MRRLFFGWLLRELQQINYKLDIIIFELKKPADFSKEDAVVLKATEDIQKHLPSELQQKGK